MDAETALRKIEQANDDHAEDAESFETDRPSYKRTFAEVAEVGSSEEIEALTERVVQDITAANERPAPEAVRRHAVDVFERHGVAIPEESALSPADSTGTDAELDADPF